MISVEATKSGYECGTRLPLNRQRLFERQCLDCVSHSYLIPILTSQRSKLNTKTCKFFTFYCFSCHILSIQKLTCGGQLIFSYFLSWNDFESSSLATQKLLKSFSEWKKSWKSYEIGSYGILKFHLGSEVLFLIWFVWSYHKEAFFQKVKFEKSQKPQTDDSENSNKVWIHKNYFIFWFYIFFILNNKLKLLYITFHTNHPQAIDFVVIRNGQFHTVVHIWNTP